MGVGHIHPPKPTHHDEHEHRPSSSHRGLRCASSSEIFRASSSVCRRVSCEPRRHSPSSPRPPSSRVAPSWLLRACCGLAGEHARAHEQRVTSAVMSPLSPLKSLSSLAVSSLPQREYRPVRQASIARTWPHVRTSPVLLVCSCQLRLIAGFIVGSWERTHGNDLARTISGTNARCDPPDPQLPVYTPTQFTHRWWTALTRHSHTAH